MTARDAALFTEESLVAGLGSLLKAIKKAGKDESQYHINIRRENISESQIIALRGRDFVVEELPDSGKLRQVQIRWDHFKS